MMWRDLFNLKGGAASIQEINQRILADATVSGTNLIVLVMAIMIACVGLNMNSVAVIIGAMLISPLMGGIVAIGYGMATYDVHFIRQSIIKLAFQVGFATLTASLYFAISPLAYSTDELLARTSPTIWDVIVALCGGIAGAVGNTRQEKSNVIPRRGYRHRSDAATLHSRIRAGIRPLPLLPRRDVPLFSSTPSSLHSRPSSSSNSSASHRMVMSRPHNSSGSASSWWLSAS